MKRKRIIFIALGWLFICFNAVGWLAVIAVPNDKYEPKGIPEILGFISWFVSGFIMLLSANRTKRKIKRMKGQELVDNFLVEK